MNLCKGRFKDVYRKEHLFLNPQSKWLENSLKLNDQWKFWVGIPPPMSQNSVLSFLATSAFPQCLGSCEVPRVMQYVGCNVYTMNIHESPSTCKAARFVTVEGGGCKVVVRFLRQKMLFLVISNLSKSHMRQ